MAKISVGAWRDDALGPMQVISGPFGEQKVHSEAPPAGTLEAEMSSVFGMVQHRAVCRSRAQGGAGTPVAAVTLHPFDDGNGRIARAVGEMALARAERSTQRFYSLSAQIQREHKEYYDMVDVSRRGTLNVTDWLEWFLACLLRAIQGAEATLAAVLTKGNFWQRWAGHQ